MIPCGVNSGYLHLRGTHVLSICRAIVSQLQTWQVIGQVARKVCGRQNKVEASPGSETVNNVRTQVGFLRTMGFLSQEGH
jgi:hypothetical protein